MGRGFPPLKNLEVMTNLDKLNLALSEWGFNVAKSVLPKVNIPSESAIGKFMYGILGVNPATYNVWNELGFLAAPLIQTMVTPMVSRMMAGIPDEQVKDLAFKFVDSFISEAERKGSVNVFGIEMGKSAFEGLRGILRSKLGPTIIEEEE